MGSIDLNARDARFGQHYADVYGRDLNRQECLPPQLAAVEELRQRFARPFFESLKHLIRLHNVFTWYSDHGVYHAIDIYSRMGWGGGGDERGILRFFFAPYAHATCWKSTRELSEPREADTSRETGFQFFEGWPEYQMIAKLAGYFHDLGMGGNCELWEELRQAEDQGEKDAIAFGRYAPRTRSAGDRLNGIRKNHLKNSTLHLLSNGSFLTGANPPEGFQPNHEALVSQFLTPYQIERIALVAGLHGKSVLDNVTIDTLSQAYAYIGNHYRDHHGWAREHSGIADDTLSQEVWHRWGPWFSREYQLELRLRGSDGRERTLPPLAVEELPWFLALGRCIGIADGLRMRGNTGKFLDSEYNPFLKYPIDWVERGRSHQVSCWSFKVLKGDEESPSGCTALYNQLFEFCPVSTEEIPEVREDARGVFGSFMGFLNSYGRLYADRLTGAEGQGLAFTSLLDANTVPMTMSHADGSHEFPQGPEWEKQVLLMRKNQLRHLLSLEVQDGWSWEDALADASVREQVSAVWEAAKASMGTVDDPMVRAAVARPVEEAVLDPSIFWTLEEVLCLVDRESAGRNWGNASEPRRYHTALSHLRGRDGRFTATGEELSFIAETLRKTCWTTFLKGPNNRVIVPFGTLRYNLGELGVIECTVKDSRDILNEAQEPLADYVAYLKPDRAYPVLYVKFDTSCDPHFTAFILLDIAMEGPRGLQDNWIFFLDHAGTGTGGGSPGAAGQIGETVPVTAWFDQSPPGGGSGGESASYYQTWMQVFGGETNVVEDPIEALRQWLKANVPGRAYCRSGDGFMRLKADLAWERVRKLRGR